ncbi:MAG: peptidylprolyl isomerase [Sporichthyaceae bacterium]
MPIRTRSAALAALAIGVAMLPATAATAQTADATACQYPFEPKTPGGKTAPLPPKTADGKTYYATVATNHGEIAMALNGKAAPCTVNSFVHLIRAKFYDRTPCHRMLNSSNGKRTAAVLQCGDPSGTGTGGPGYSFADENLAGATYAKGVVAMANAGPNTNGSQFFMMFKDSDFPPSYTPFGTILRGVEVLEKIAAGGLFLGPSGNPDAPLMRTEIEKVVVSPKKPKL